MIYTGKNLKEISFPLGGIGTGSIGLAGNGRFLSWEIFGRPDKKSINGYTHFAVRAEYPDGRAVTKILNSDLETDLAGHTGAKSQTMCGFPHFSECEFRGEFPFAFLTFSDEDFPAVIHMTAFSPFIPLDADNSTIPAGLFEITAENKTNEELKITFFASLGNPYEASLNKAFRLEVVSGIKLINADKDENEIGYGDLTLATPDPAVLQTYWYRGAWMDGLATYQREIFKEGKLKERDYDCPGKKDMCSVSVTKSAEKHENATARFSISWNTPNAYNYWNPVRDEDGKDVTWKNYYAVLFKDSAASAKYAIEKWDELYGRTMKFHDALFSSTLDSAVIDAVSSNLSVLRTATVLRLEDGSFYGWEGCYDNFGSCEGTCSHVWNYAYAICFLFPELERSIRDLEFKYSTDEDGRMSFRMGLPLGRDYMTPHACVDGQMGAVIKTLREWKICGDGEWLKKTYPSVKKVIDYATSDKNFDEWDRDGDGVLEGRQHHTLDMELFGPSSWLEGFYIAALCAGAEMAEYLGDLDGASRWRSLAEKGRKWTEENLFNGEYYIQKIDISDKSTAEHFDALGYWNEEAKQLKYQIGSGCEIDQMVAQWHASLCGIEDVFDKEHRMTALGSMMKYIFKDSMRDFINPWRVFALGDESAAVMCEYPENAEKPVIPVPYCEEAMTGFEYAFAGLLAQNGMIDEALKVVKAVRARYDGEKRNPWDEIECGHNYARTMASFALLPIFSGFTFDMPKNRIGFDPIINKNSFRCPFSLDGGWGEVEFSDSKMTLKLHEGSLSLKELGIGNRTAKKLVIDGRIIPFTNKTGGLCFELCRITDTLAVEF